MCIYGLTLFNFLGGPNREGMVHPVHRQRPDGVEEAERIRKSEKPGTG